MHWHQAKIGRPTDSHLTQEENKMNTLQMTLTPKHEHEKISGPSKTLAGWEHEPEAASEFRRLAELDHPFFDEPLKPLRFDS